VTIRKGEPWGEAVQSPDGLHLVRDDGAARAWVVHHRDAGRDIPPLGLLGGDLARTMGGGSPGRFPGIVTRAPVDVVRVESEGRTTWVIAHVVGRRSWWRGEVGVAMNAQYLRGRDVAPRSHPDDGKIDLLRVAASMSLRARSQAWHRARTGTHVPHPAITVSQAGTVDWQFDRPLTLWVDGERWCTTRAVHLVVEPDALIVHA
jgi:YegS C-terminal NAD kinase beta sandwich-like domain